MQYALALIDKAAEMCGGSYYKLSKEWGVAESTISVIRSGKRKIPLRRVPKLAELAQVDPKEAMLRVAEEQAAEGSEERDLLGKALATIVAAMLLIFVSLGLVQPLKSYAGEATNGLDNSSFYTSWNMQKMVGKVMRLALLALCSALALWHSHSGTRTLALGLR